MSQRAASILAAAVVPALDLLPRRMDTPDARVALLAIGLQESGLEHRRQLGGGPARGLWQFERGGGCVGVLNHAASRDLMRWVCHDRGASASTGLLHTRLEHDDILAAAAARLLLYTDPHPLPAEDDADGAWSYYLRVWRPGQPHPDSWAALHAEAMETVL